MKRLLYTVFVVALGSVTTLAQLLTNDGAAIFSSSGALIFVDGEMVNQGLGTYDHSGTIELTGDCTNNAGNSAFVNGSPGTVNMTGGTQTIKGTDPTLFYDLILTGSGDKAQQVNATVTDSLALNDKELATDTFIMHITNTSLTSITRTTGFVSSIDTGGLARDMANTATYLFPVGSSVGTQRYRPVEIAPTVATAHTYKVRMANVDATTEGYDRSINDATFCIINPAYYHRIYQTSGVSPADITIYYDDALDNAYQAIAHWQNAPRWEDISPVTNTVNVSPTLSFITKTAWNDFLLPAYALATTTPAAPFAGNDTSICFAAGLTDTLIITGGIGTEWWDDNTLTTSLGTGDTLVITPALGQNVYFVTQSVGTCQGPYDSVIVTLDTPITVTISGITTICEGDPTVLTASGGSSYLWSTAETTPSITVFPPIGQTVYNVVATAGACSTTATATVTVNILPVASITGLNSLCAGETLTLTAGIELSYSWDTSPISTSQIITVTPAAGTITTYTLTVSNGCGSDIISHLVSVEDILDAGNDTALCKNTDTIGYGATIDASPAGGTWSSPDSLVFPDNMQPDGFIDHVSIPWGADYEIVYTSTSGNCTDTLLLEVTGADAGLDTSSCTGTSTFFLPEALPPGGEWSGFPLNSPADINIIDPFTGEVSSDGLAGDYVFVYETFGASGKGCPDSVTIITLQYCIGFAIH